MKGKRGNNRIRAVWMRCVYILRTVIRLQANAFDAIFRWFRLTAWKCVVLFRFAHFALNRNVLWATGEGGGNFTFFSEKQQFYQAVPLRFQIRFSCLCHNHFDIAWWWCSSLNDRSLYLVVFFSLCVQFIHCDFYCWPLKCLPFLIE